MDINSKNTVTKFNFSAAIGSAEKYIKNGSCKQYYRTWKGIFVTQFQIALCHVTLLPDHTKWFTNHGGPSY